MTQWIHKVWIDNEPPDKSENKIACQCEQRHTAKGPVGE